MDQIRAYAWIHFATTAKHTTSHQQSALVADEMMVEFDKRFPPEDVRDAALDAALSTIADLEHERDSLQAVIEKNAEAMLTSAAEVSAEKGGKRA